MKLSYNQLRKFEAGSTSHWTVVFESGGYNLTPLNLLGGKAAPVQDVDYVYFKITTKTIEVGPGCPIHFPVTSVEVPESIDLTMIDNDNHDAQDFIRKWVKDSNIGKGISPGPSKLGVVRIYKHNKQGKVLSSEAFKVFVADELRWKGDQQFSTLSFPLRLTVIGVQ